MAKKKKAKTAKAKSKKPKAPTTTRGTAGHGFDFEDQVGAWLVLSVLTGQPLPGIQGRGIRTQCQTDKLGWLIDDLLVTSTVSEDDQRHLAVSCKGNTQVTSSGLPKNFVQLAWQQWSSAATTGPMKRNGDSLMLVTRGHVPAFQPTWAELKKESAGTDPALSLGRILGNSKQRKIFASVRNPAKEAGLVVSDVDVLELIQRLLVVPVDFHLNPSEFERTAIGQCRGLLTSGSFSEASELWSALIEHLKKTRLGHGTLDIAQLWRDALKAHPDFTASWSKLQAISKEYKDNIVTVFPTGSSLERKADVEGLALKIAAGSVCVLFGESGSGKSALLKSVLDGEFAGSPQIWLGPDQTRAVSSELERKGLGIDHPLLDTLDASPSPHNILVIDAAERLTSAAIAKTKGLINALLERKTQDRQGAWRVVVVGQTDAWTNGQLQDVVGQSVPPSYELKKLTDDEVTDVLLSIDRLRWLASHADAVSALTNLRTLAWVVEAESRFQGHSGVTSFSPSAIADRLWSFWTNDRPTLHRLLVRLAVREADFEHSFAISQLDAADVEAFESAPQSFPLQKNSDGKVQFQHDLASDWSRFQRLKEMYSDTAGWAKLASNPLWTGALRMLGQFLLRQKIGERNAWDIAFEAAEQGKDAMLLARDVLLDALCLDPNAEAFLNERVEMLLANNAARLTRLLRRFEHAASVPGVNPEVLKRNPDLSLLLESQYRTPIYGRWPAIANFLYAHRDRVASLVSPVVSALCERWLVSTPQTLGTNTPTPFRKEFAQLALDTARQLQAEQGKSTIMIGDIEGPIYSAAFAAAPDLPDDTAEWALEMAQRRAVRSDVAEQIRKFRAKQAEEHKERLANDPEYRARHEERRHAPTFIGSGRKLPPWPLGPRKKLEPDFRKSCIHSAALYGLMRARPAAAAEVLLASIIEGSPEESYTRTRIDRDVGVEFDHESYPTAYWHSSFFGFLAISSDAALAALNQLVDFCTIRSEADSRWAGEPKSPKVTLKFADGSERSFGGGYWVFTWSQVDSTNTGALHCALAALERWLCVLLDREMDISPHVHILLRNSHSVAVLGVLVNVGKHRPDLFKGPLKPLLAVHDLYVWDYYRVNNFGSGFFDAFSWARQGKTIFETAKEWVSAAYRKVTLQKIVSDLISTDADLSKFVLGATAAWTPPDSEKEALEFRILVAELDYRNYRSVLDPKTGKEIPQFEYPEGLQREVLAFNSGKAPVRQTVNLPYVCQRVLSDSGLLNPEQASALARALTDIEGDNESELDEDTKSQARIAVAATLLVKAPEWMAQHKTLRQQAREIVDAAMLEIGDSRQSLRSHASRSGLEFVAHVVFAEWLSKPSSDTDASVLRILTGGDERAAQVLVVSAYAYRQQLGERWWRLLQVVLFWAGLIILAPRYDNDEDIAQPLWQRWLHRLRACKLTGVAASVDSINPLDIAQRVENFERARAEKRNARYNGHFEIQKGRRLAGGLEIHFLQSVFVWLFGDNAQTPSDPVELQQKKRLVLAFWDYEAWCRIGSVDDDDRDYKPLSQMGYAVVSTLTQMALHAPEAEAKEFWQPALSLGPLGHYAVGQFLTNWFMQITEATDVTAYAARWRPMIEYVHTTEDWDAGRKWYHAQQLERQVLGFGSEAFFKRSTNVAALVGGMRDLYKAWAEKRLDGNQDNLAGFCGFLSSPVARSIRLDALQWIAAALQGELGTDRWYRDSTASSFMHFMQVVVSEHAGEITANPTVRQAVLTLLAQAVSRQLPTALALQERVRRML